MLKRSLERRWITGGFGIVLLIMSFASYVSHQNSVRLITSANKVRRTNEVLKTLTGVVSTLTDIEAGRRGYILFGDPEELDRYNVSIRRIYPKLNKLRRLLVNDAEQQQRLAKLDILITQRVSLYRHSTDLFRNNRDEASRDSIIAQVKQNKREIRRIVSAMQAEEEEQLQRQIAQSQRGFQLRMLIEFSGTLLTFTVLFSIFGLLYRQMLKRHQAEVLQHALAQEKELSQLKLNFFSMVSHEFRTPLSVILGAVQLLESGQTYTEPKKLRNLHRIQSSARLMTKLLTDILTLTRAEAGKLECQPTLIDVESFCLNLIEDIQSTTEPIHQIKLINHGEKTHAYLDEKLLYSILGNLLSNAIKYSPEGGVIQFSLGSQPGAIVFQIQDQGIGIPSEELQSLYEPFQRSSNVGKIVGSGLGLAVVKTCVELHEGHITVESQVGVGTTFVITIPQIVAVETEGEAALEVSQGVSGSS